MNQDMKIIFQSLDDKMTLKYFKNLAYEEMGEENDEIILFLHSKLLDKWIWKKQKQSFNQCFKDYHCIFLDLPNHGNSRAEDEFSIYSSSEQINEFIEHIIGFKDTSKINLVALGLGGQIAIEMLNENPDSIDNLILSGIEIADFKENDQDSVVNRLAKTQAEYLNEKPDTFIIKAYLRYFGIPKEYFNDMERILDRPVKEEKKIAYESLNYAIPKDLTNNEELLEKENMIIIYGNKEDLNCTKSAIGLKTLFKNAKLVEIDKGNHLWNIIDYELFNSILIDFIKSHRIRENPKVKTIR